MDREAWHAAVHGGHKESYTTGRLNWTELKWTGMGEFNSEDHYIYYYGQKSLRRNGVALIVNKRVQNEVLRCNLKNDRMISIHFPGKPFNITVIQIVAIITDAKEGSWSWLVLWRPTTPSRNNTKKDVLFIMGDWNVKVGIQEIPAVIGKCGVGV